MKLTDRKIFLATLAAFVLPSFPCAKVLAADDADILVIDEDYKITKSYARDWLDSSGDIIFYGGGGENFRADISGKQIAINGGVFTKIFGGYTSEGNVYNNELWINGGKFQEGIFGGITSSGSIVGNKIFKKLKSLSQLQKLQATL